MANVSSSNGLEKRPKLRFPGFDEPWKAEKLSDFAERVTRKNTNNETSLPLTISSKDGLVDQISYFNKTVASKDMSGYYLLKNGEYAYNKSYSVGYDFGSVKRLDRYDMGALSTLYICFALKKHDSDFIKAYFDSLKWYREIYMISAEGARNHGLLNVPTDEFFDTKHYIPMDSAEQRKIADFLIALEHRIEAQQSLVDNLKKYKRGLLYTIEAGFQDCVQYTRLGELFSVQGGFAFKSEFFGGSGNTVIRISDINNGIVSTQNAVSYPLSIKIDERFIVQKGDLLIAMSGATTGKTGIYNENKKSYLNQRVGKFVCKSETYSLEYLSEILESSSFSKSLKNLLIAGAQPNISPSDIESIPIPIFNEDVSKHITGLLHKYSLLILQEEKLLASLLQMRKGVAQQLFI